MKRLTFPGYLLLLLLPATTRAAQAQDAVLEGTLPDSVVVTATRLATAARHTGRRVAVWTARDLDALPVTSFDELLRTVGGVEIFSRTGFGIQSDLTMRGSTFNGVLVLLDGARLNDPMTGHFAADLPVPLSEIARIEVLRGPASGLYGPDALGGVVHLLTYGGLADAGADASFFDGQLGAQAGAHGALQLDGAGRYVDAAWSAGVASTYGRADGEAVRDAAGAPVEGPAGTVRTDFDRQAHTLYLTHRWRRAALYTRLGMDRRDFNAFHFYTVSALDFAREATETYWGQVRLRSLADGPTRWSVNVAARQHDDEFAFNPGFPVNRHTSRLLTAQAQLTHRLNARWTLTGGASAQGRAIDSNNLGTHDDAAVGLFVLARIQPLDGLTVHTGTRVDYDAAYGLEPMPHLSAAYTSSWWTLRASGGRALRAPTYIERYINFTQPPQRDRNYGNPDLHPERAWTYEAGADVYPFAGLSLHATAFAYRVKDLIDFARQPPGETPSLADSVLLAQNILQVDTRGIELDAELSRTLGGGRVRLAATYTWMDSDLGDVARGTTFKYASSHARRLVQAAATFDAGPVRMGTQVLWKEKLDATSYAVVNLHAGYGVTLGPQRLVFSGELRNLFDEQYTEVLDAPMPGRWWLVGVHVAL